MKFNVTVGLGEREVGSFLAALTPRQMGLVKITQVADSGEDIKTDDKKRTYTKGRGSTIVMQGDKEGKPTTPMQLRILGLHEELEAQGGIGTITHTMLNKAAVAHGISKYPTGPTAELLKAGWLVYVEQKGK